MKNLSLFFFSLIFIAASIIGCNKEYRHGNLKPYKNKDKGTLANSSPVLASTPFAQILRGNLGSTVGPRGDLFVPEAADGKILRIDPKTGEVTTFASKLPSLIPAVGIGGVSDVAFRGNKAYALVTMVDDPNLFPTGQVNGIYRIDGPDDFTIIADIGAYNIKHPPSGFDFFVSTGVLYSIYPYHNGFLVSDGHLNRVLYVTLNGDISIFRSFGNIVPTGLLVKSDRIYMSEAGPILDGQEIGKVVTFSKYSRTVTTLTSGAPVVVGVAFGQNKTLFGLSQGVYGGGDPGSPALPNTGSLFRVNADGSFTVIAEDLNLPTSLEIIGNTAYIVTLTGEVWTIDNITGGFHHKHHLSHHH